MSAFAPATCAYAIASAGSETSEQVEPRRDERSAGAREPLVPHVERGQRTLAASRAGRPSASGARCAAAGCDRGRSAARRASGCARRASRRGSAGESRARPSPSRGHRERTRSLAAHRAGRASARAVAGSPARVHDPHRARPRSAARAPPVRPRPARRRSSHPCAPALRWARHESCRAARGSHRLEEVRLALPVVADDRGETWRQLELSVGEVAEVGEPEPAHPHRSRHPRRA